MSGYLETMPPDEREAIIYTLAEITKTIPNSVVSGGRALRLLFEARTGKPMFGSGKGDFDIYVPPDSISELRANPPEGYSINTDPRFFPPEGGNPKYYVVLTDTEGHHIDVIGRKVSKIETIEIDGHQIPVLALEEQIADKLNLARQTHDLKDLPQQDRARHGFYAARLMEIAENEQVDESLLPPNWREKLSALAVIGEIQAEIHAKIRAEKEALIAELEAVFKATHQQTAEGNRHQKAQNAIAQQPRINEYLHEAIPTIIETAANVSRLDDYVSSLRERLQKYAEIVEERIRAKVVSV
jgi:hypothetical protein